jgi:S-adenosylmethionine synthetase
MDFEISHDPAPRGAEATVEIVERKGLGHPDSICDALAEELSLALCRLYLERVGAILHHNVDKVLLAAGASEPHYGGGRVIEPIRLFLAGRATLDVGGPVPIDELAEEVTRSWLERHLHALDARRHVEVSSLVRPGSSELVAVFGGQTKRRSSRANDTSCGVGYAPLSETERVVLAVEARLNADGTRTSDPALGEDVKVMAVRRGDDIRLTVSCALIDAALRDLDDYAKAKQRAAELALEAAGGVTDRPVRVEVNAADDLASGDVFLTVTGTSAEAGDDGQAGRGNRCNGLITPGRPMTIESVAGKNPVTHVGKLYNLSAGLIAERVVEEVAGVRGAECRLVSRIGSPIEQPQLVELRIAGADPAGDPELAAQVERIARSELEAMPRLATRCIAGDLKLDRWPLHA